MVKQPSLTMLQRQLFQLEKLGDEQLDTLLEQLEHQKRKLPIEDHSIIDWGIGVIKARILDEEKLMSEIDEAWKAILSTDYSDFVREHNLENLDLKENEDARETLCYEGWEKLDKILQLAILEDRIREEFEKAIEQFKLHLYQFCSVQGEEDLYLELIEAYIGSLEEYQGEKFALHYDTLIEILDESDH